MKNSQKGFARVSLLIGLFISLLILAGWMWVDFNTPYYAVPNGQADVATSTDETAGWKTYIVSGFELKSPVNLTITHFDNTAPNRASWSIVPDNDAIEFGPVIYLDATFTDNDYSPSDDYTYEDLKKMIKAETMPDSERTITKNEEVTFAGRPAIHVVYQSTESADTPYTNSVYYFTHKNVFYTVTVQNGDENLEKIAATFTFAFTNSQYVEYKPLSYNTKVGEKLGNFTVTKIDGPLVYTKGEATISGTFGRNEIGLIGTTFNVTSADGSLVRITGDNRNLWFCFNNEEVAAKAAAQAADRNVMIKIKDYIYNTQESEVCDEATLVEVMK